ncbi:MAG: type II secretion system protein [Candidatus Eremiobacteraeota bacterium]|nr:type II secretion system protein [Candidatus Eremiobacteraeota bacterium]
MFGLVVCKRSAFSLSEVVFSLGLFAFVAVVVTGILMGSLALQESSEEEVAAGNLARTVLEQWKARPYSEVAALVSTPESPQAFIVDGRDFSSQVTVEPLTPAGVNPDGEILVLKVRLDWTELSTQSGDGRTERPASLELASVVSPESSI